MLVKSIDQSTHTIIPELDHTTVQTGENPWSFRVEGQTLNSVTLSLELRQHIPRFTKQKQLYTNQITEDETMEKKNKQVRFAENRKKKKRKSKNIIHAKLQTDLTEPSSRDPEKPRFVQRREGETGIHLRSDQLKGESDQAKLHGDDQ